MFYHRGMSRSDPRLGRIGFAVFPDDRGQRYGKGDWARSHAPPPTQDRSVDCAGARSCPQRENRERGTSSRPKMPAGFSAGD